MTVGSGMRDFQYTRYPFEMDVDEIVLFSGLIFEETMFAILAEMDLYNQWHTSGLFGDFDRNWVKYINKGASVVANFEPKNDGSNLDGLNPYVFDGNTGVLSGLGNVNFIDHVQDMRDKLSGIFHAMSYDSPSHIQTIVDDYFITKLGYTSGSWRHADLTDSFLFDIDIRELQYKPFVRMGPVHRLSETWNYIADDYVPDYDMPIFPTACDTDGNFPKTLARDTGFLGEAFTKSDEYYWDQDIDTIITVPNWYESGMAAMGSGHLLVMGDLIGPETRLITRFNILTDVLDSTASGSVVNVYPRQNYWMYRTLESGVGVFDPNFGTSMDSGFYRFQLANPNGEVDGYVSGNSCFFPSRESDIVDDYGTKFYKTGSVGVRTRASGFHIFDTAHKAKTISGVQSLSPHNGSIVWHNFADDTIYYRTPGLPEGYNFKTQPAGGYKQSTNEMVSFEINSSGVVASGGALEFFGMALHFDMHDISTSKVVTFSQPLRRTPSANSWDGDTTFNIYVEDHTPASGGAASIQGYYIRNASISSTWDYAGIIYDGSTLRGTLRFGRPGVPVVETYLNLNGTVNSHLYCSSPSVIQGLSTTDSYSLFHMELYKNPNSNPGGAPVFPLPSASGLRPANSGFSEYNERKLVYAENIHHRFKQLNKDNFTVPENYFKFILPSGEFDISDGSSLLYFLARETGDTWKGAFVGRVKEVTSGSEDQLQITEIWGGMNTEDWNRDGTVVGKNKGFEPYRFCDTIIYTVGAFT